MKIEIWSDIMCPFCYIGKKHFEKAIANLPFKNQIEVEWKSFQLSPDYFNTTGEDLYTYLARTKGMSVAQAKQLTAQVQEMATNAGATINFATNIPANSFNAHRLLHLAKQKGIQNDAEEALFKAHFQDSKDIANMDILLEIANGIGIDPAESKSVLTSDDFAEAVRYDLYEAQQIGVRGVPYFVFDRKYALSGAQPVPAFEQALIQSYTAWQATQQNNTIQSLNKNSDAVCDENGCEL